MSQWREGMYQAVLEWIVRCTDARSALKDWGTPTRVIEITEAIDRACGHDILRREGVPPQIMVTIRWVTADGKEQQVAVPQSLAEFLDNLEVMSMTADLDFDAGRS